MSRREQGIAHILKILHPVLLAALAGPVCYAVCDSRVDAWVLPLYLTGLCLLPLSAAVRAAERKVRSMWAFLLISAAVFAVTLLLGNRLAGSAFRTSAELASLSKVPSVIAMAVLIVGGAWMTLSAIRLRLRENLRERARRENDLTWQERGILAEKPSVPCLILFVIAYLVGLLNACPPLCNIAIGSGMAYLIVVLVYRSYEVTRSYLQETQNLTNVPAGKISRIRHRLIAALAGTLLLVAMTAFFTANLRVYWDLRTWELKGKRIEVESREVGESSGNFEVIKEEFGLGIEEERRDPPEWLQAFEQFLSYALPALLALFLLYRVWRSLTETAKDFAEIREENGDVAVRLEDAEEETSSLGIGRIRRFMRGQPLTEQEKVRREYRRTISKYRSEAPQRSETPAEIESGTAFPQGFDIASLHERYEKARYGRQ